MLSSPVVASQVDRATDLHADEESWLVAAIVAKASLPFEHHTVHTIIDMLCTMKTLAIYCIFHQITFIKSKIRGCSRRRRQICKLFDCASFLSQKIWLLVLSLGGIFHDNVYLVDILGMKWDFLILFGFYWVVG